MPVFVWVYLPEGMSVAVRTNACSYCRFARACRHTCELCLCVFCPPAADWLERRPPSVWSHRSASAMLLSPNKATLAQSCLPPKHDPGMMKLCALPNCQGSFTPWYLVPLPLLLLLFLGCSRLTFCYRLSHSQPVVYLSIQPPDFTTPFDVINQSSTAREKEREWEKIWNVSKEWPTKDLHL